MSKIFKNFLLGLLFCSACNLCISSESVGYIKGTLLLDESLERKIYISLIASFEKENAVSESMIIKSSLIDSLGRFSVNLDNLPDGWCLLRLHIVKKGNPPASLIIGGLDENYYFIIANRISKIELHNTTEKPIFSNLSISGAPYMNTVKYITKLAHYPDSLNFENSLVEKEFFEEVVSDKLKAVADTCKNLLVSLYALNQIDFYSDYAKDPAFYRSFYTKWKDEKSPYLESLKRKIPMARNSLWPYLLLLLVVGAGFILARTLIRDGKGRKIKKLSVQERRIFELLQKRATNQEIADELNIELSTVKSHVSNIFSKLKISSRKDAQDFQVKY
jgi:DNA-binding CsgD family transcriptional regulator